MDGQPSLGQIVILNGAPRSGKSSIAAAIQGEIEGIWMNLGVDVFARHVTPKRYQPGIGLRPGGERPDLEELLPAMIAALFESVAAHSRNGLNVVVDVGLHDAYSRPLGLLSIAASRLKGLPVLFAGVRCPLEAVLRRRLEAVLRPRAESAGGYATAEPDGAVPEAITAWQREVHTPGIYDLEVDTSIMNPGECAQAIGARLNSPPEPSALWQAAEASRQA